VEDNDGVTGVTGVTTIIALRGEVDDEIGANAEHCLLLAMMVTMAMARNVSMMEMYVMRYDEMSDNPAT
jgi:hypothetical protein